MADEVSACLRLLGVLRKWCHFTKPFIKEWGCMVYYTYRIGFDKPTRVFEILASERKFQNLVIIKNIQEVIDNPIRLALNIIEDVRVNYHQWDLGSIIAFFLAFCSLVDFTFPFLLLPRCFFFHKASLHQLLCEIVECTPFDLIPMKHIY